MVSHDQITHVAPDVNCHDLRNLLVPLMTTLVAHDGNGITCPKCHTAPHFDCIDLRNAVLHLMTPLASCDADVNASGIT